MDRRVLAAGAGLANVAVVVVAGFVLRSLSYDADPLLAAAVLGYSGLATFLLGAGPAYALLRYRIVSAPVFSAILTAHALGNRGALHSFVEVYFNPIFVTVVLLVVAFAGAVEFGLRRWLVPQSLRPL